MMEDKELMAIMRGMITEQQSQLEKLLKLLEEIVDSGDATIEVENKIRETMLKMQMKMNLNELEEIKQ